MRALFFTALTAFLILSTACSFGSRNKREDPATVLAAVQSAHDAYVQSINANKVDDWLSALSDGAGAGPAPS